MFGVKNKKKTRKTIFNVLFFGLGIGCLVSFVYLLIFVWSKYGFVVQNKYISSQILEMTNFCVYFNIVLFIIGFGLNIFVINGEVNKIISKKYYKRVSIIEVIIFLIGIITLMISPIFMRASNLVMDNYKLKAIYCMSYCTSLAGSFFLFYLFSFISVITEDESYSRAHPYFYRINDLKYNVFYGLISKRLDKECVNGEFFNSNYKVNYLINHSECEYVYAFINLESINDEFLMLFEENRLSDFIEYLYGNILDKNKNLKIVYFICVKEDNDNFNDMVRMSIYQDSHTTIVHTLVNLKTHDLFIGGIRDDKKINIQEYSSLKTEIDKILVDVIDKR